jgi:hypothetical protein
MAWWQIKHATYILVQAMAQNMISRGSTRAVVLEVGNASHQ